MAHTQTTGNLDQETTSPLEIGAAISLALATFVTLAVILIRCSNGIDLTDEGLYLLMMANPRSYEASVSQFGFVYHPLYRIANGDIAVIRQINDLISFILAWILCIRLFRRSLSGIGFKSANRILLVAFSAAAASSSLLVMSFELAQSPSYDTLAYQSLLLAAIGIVLADEGAATKIFPYVLIGISGWLTFMAKPPSAAALGLIVILYWLIAGKFEARGVAVAIATAVVLLFGTAWMIDGSIHLFAQRLIKGIAIGKWVRAENPISSIFRWDEFPLHGTQLGLLFLDSAAASIIFFCGTSRNEASKIACGAAAIIISIAIAVTFLGEFPLRNPWGRYSGLQILAVPIGCLIVFIFKKGIRSVTRSDVALAISFLVIPHAYAFGTDRPYWLNAEGASLFWILSGTVFIMKANGAGWRALMSASGVAGLISALLIYASMEYPMRQTQPLRLDATHIVIDQQGNQLTLSSDFAEYISALRQLARSGGFEAGTPIIDLTGHSPGVVYLLNGSAPGMPWLMGGYEGSDSFAAAALDIASCEDISRAWVLTEPSGPGKLSATILMRYGIDLEKGYRDLGIVQSPAAPFPEGYKQHLLRPQREHEEAKAACELHRRDRAS